MKKRIDMTEIVSELRGSVFFPKKEVSPSPTSEEAPLKQLVSESELENKQAHHDTITPRYHETTVSRDHDATIPFTENELLELVRKAVKQIGKEAATQRLTLEEKQALDDIEYNYKRQGIKTSGNEIMRIATNYIVHDYRQNGENSIVAKVLKKLNS